MRSRTPRNYAGVKNPEKKIAELLPQILDDLVRKSADPREEVFQFWNGLMGEKMALLAQPVSLVEGVLTVKVKSSTLYNLLVVHERPRLLRRLQEKFSVRSILFRVG